MKFIKTSLEHVFCTQFLKVWYDLLVHGLQNRRGVCRKKFYLDEVKKSFSLWHSGSPSLESQGDGPLSPSDKHPSSNPKQLMLSGVSLLAVSNVNNPVGLVCLPYVMWSAHFFVTHIQTEKISSWNGPTVHVCCFMLVRASTKIFVSRVRQTAKKSSLAEKFVSRVIR